MVKNIIIGGVCVLLSGCGGPALQSNAQYRANYQLAHSVPATQLTNQQICDAIQPPVGSTYDSAITEAQKRKLTTCKWD